MFYNITYLFLDQKYPTTNTLVIKVCEIKEVLYDWSYCSNNVVRIMASRMLQKFDQYWKVCHRVMTIAVILDLRYKVEDFGVLFSIDVWSEFSTEMDRIRQMCSDLIFKYQSKCNKGQ